MEHKKMIKIFKMTILLCLLVLAFFTYRLKFKIKKLKFSIHSITHKRYLDFNTDNGMILKVNVLSYSLFGNTWDRYAQNVELVAKEAANNSLYKNWIVRIYHDKYTITPIIVARLTERYQNLEFFNVSNFDDLESINGMVWRFLVIADLTVDVACIRDLDSKLLERESEAVKVWLESGKLVHSMKDNPAHSIPMLGGMWCYRNELNRDLGIKIATICTEKCMDRDPIKQREVKKGDDQDVLTLYVWPHVSHNVLIHDSYLCEKDTRSQPFPTKRDDTGEFVGQYREKSGRIVKCPIACRPNEHQDWEYC
ncbi:uncharacterized protein LOC136090612 [Hydra vulgaris]|uniref:Uncharacterized protein LOC136090612 n=1 Tax=Hydra vulgaris TaxID=6087 RepID=A0ABM4DGA7_HYDVU